MRGIMDNGKTVIHALEKLGGINAQNLSGECSRVLYFIRDSDKVILCVGDTDYRAPDIIRNFREINPNFQYCVYYQGSTQRPKEIINALKNLGGIDPGGIGGGNPAALYYIDYRNHISEAMASIAGGDYATDIYCCLIDLGVELHLPEIKERKLISIRGNKYDEEEVFNRIKELKPAE
jgi:hypothetical protein